MEKKETIVIVSNANGITVGPYCSPHEAISRDNAYVFNYFNDLVSFLKQHLDEEFVEKNSLFKITELKEPLDKCISYLKTLSPEFLTKLYELLPDLSFELIALFKGIIDANKKGFIYTLTIDNTFNKETS